MLLQKCQPEEGEHDHSVLLVMDISLTADQKDYLLVEVDNY